MFNQNTNATLRVVSASCLLFFILALCVSTRAQSQDPSNPTPIDSNKVEGKAGAGGATYYYRFMAQKGTLTITLQGKTNNYATQFEADVLNVAGTHLGDMFVSADDTAKSTSKDFTFASAQPVTIVVKLLKDSTVKWQKYSLTFSGTTSFAKSGGGNKNAGDKGALPDLIVNSAKFYFSKAVVGVKNVGNAPSGAANLALLLLSGTSPNSNVTKTFNKTIPPLNPGEIYKVEFNIGTLTFSNHARRLIVDDKNTVAESNEKNNELFSDSDPFADEGTFPNSALANLTFSQVKFIAPSRVHYCVKNIGQSTSDAYQVRTTIFSGPGKDSGVASLGGNSKNNPFSLPGNSLKPGEVACQDFAFASYGTSVLEGRGRLIEIIVKDGLKDANPQNKSLFSPGAEGLWGHQ